jgi:hypothetical protein
MAMEKNEAGEKQSLEILMSWSRQTSRRYDFYR